jgi:hypothetical protein
VPSGSSRSGSAATAVRGKKKREALGASLSGIWFCLGPQTAGNVAEDVLDLVAKKDKDNDDNDRDEYQDEGVLDHTLAFLVTMQELTELQIKV